MNSSMMFQVEIEKEIEKPEYEGKAFKLKDMVIHIISKIHSAHKEELINNSIYNSLKETMVSMFRKEIKTLFDELKNSCGEYYDHNYFITTVLCLTIISSEDYVIDLFNKELAQFE